MIYFVIRKYKSEYSEDYRIERYSKSNPEANKFLAALNLLEDNENVSFFIQSHVVTSDDVSPEENAA